MLEITVPDGEFFDESTNTFIKVKGRTLHLEHSLVSVSKWEQKWHKPFISKKEKTNEEVMYYIKCMTTSSNVDPRIYNFLSLENLREIEDYINNPMTATTFSDTGKKSGKSEIITNEVIYYWMTEMNIPPEYAKWHLNHLLTLIEVAARKKSPKKMSKKEQISRNAAINAANRARFNSKG